MKDYYVILKVPRKATTSEIKKSYYKLARENHPDVSKDPRAHEIFVEINEAYEVLGNIKSRKNYNFLYDSKIANAQYKSRQSANRRESKVNSRAYKGQTKGREYASQSKDQFDKSAKQNSRFTIWEFFFDILAGILGS